MARKIVYFNIPASVTYDDARTTAEPAIEDFYRALAEAEQAGFMERTLIDMNYGGPGNVSHPQDPLDEEEDE